MHALNGNGGLPHLDEVVPIEVLPLPQFPGGRRGSSHPFPHPFLGLQLPQDSPPHCFGSLDGCILDSDECQALEAEVEQHEALRRQIEQQQLTDIAFEDLHFLDELFPQPPQEDTASNYQQPFVNEHLRDPRREGSLASVASVYTSSHPHPAVPGAGQDFAYQRQFPAAPSMSRIGRTLASAPDFQLPPAPPFVSEQNIITGHSHMRMYQLTSLDMAAHPETVHPVSLAASPNGTQQQQQRQQHPSSSLSLLGAHASQHQQLLLSLHAQHAHTSRAASMPYLPILPLSAAPSGQRHAHTPGFASQQHMGLDAHSGGGASMHGRHIGSCGNLPCGSSPLQRLSPITEASMPGMGLAPPLRRHASGTYGQYLLQHHQRHLHLQQQQQQMLSQQLSQQQLQMLVGGPGLNAAQAVCAASEALLGLAAGGCGGMPSVRSSGGSANHTAGTGTGTGTHSASCAAADDGEGETSRPAAGTSRPESCSSIPDHAHGGIRRHAGVGGRGRGGRRSGSARLLAASHPLDRAASAQDVVLHAECEMADAASGASARPAKCSTTGAGAGAGVGGVNEREREGEGGWLSASSAPAGGSGVGGVSGAGGFQPSSPRVMRKNTITKLRKLKERAVSSDMLALAAGATGGAGGSAAAAAAGRPAGCARSAPSFADVVMDGFFPPGAYTFSIGNLDDVRVEVQTNGVLVWAGQEYPSISSFALHVLKTRNPERRACDGWREVRLNGKRLEVFKHAWIHARMMAEHAATTQG